MTQRYLTYPQAATYIGITVKALRHRVARRSIPFIKEERRVLFDRHLIDRHMASRRVMTRREEKQQHGQSATA